MTQQFAETARIAIVVGGCFSVVAKYPECVGADRVIYVDAKDEIEAVRRARPRPLGKDRLLSIELAPQTATVRQLLSASQDRFRANNGLAKEHFDIVNRSLSTKSANLSEGMGQVPALGYLAWLDRLDEGVRRTWQGMINGLTHDTEGGLRKVEILVFHSNAGGTGRGIANKLVNDLVWQFELKPWTITHYVAGRVSFTCEDIPDQVRFNNCVGILEDVTFHSHPSTPDSTVQRWFGVELPTVGTNQKLREQYAGLLAQALSAQGVTDLFKGDQNWQTVGEWGKFMLIQCGWFSPPDFGEDSIIDQAVKSIRDQVKEIQAAKDADVSNWRIAFEPSAPAATVDGEAERNFLTRLAEYCVVENRAGRYVERLTMDSEVKRLDVAGHETPVVKGAGADSPLADLQPLLDQDRSRAVQWWSTLTNIVQAAIDAEMARREKDISERLKNVEKDYQQALNGLTPNNVLERARFSLQNPGGIISLFVGRATAYRQILREQAASEDRVRVLEAQLGRCREALKQARDPFDEIEATLGELFSDSSDLNNGYLEFKAITEPDILDLVYDAVKTQDATRIKHAIWLHYVKGFTLRGIQYILGESTARPLAIVRKLEALQFNANASDEERKDRDTWPTWVEGPTWGGGAMNSRLSRRICIFPPVVGRDWAELEEARNKLEAPIHLVQTSTIAAGAAIMVLDYYRVQQLDDLLPPDYQLDLKEALTHVTRFAWASTPSADARVYCDEETLRKMKITMAGDVKRLKRWTADMNGRPVAARRSTSAKKQTAGTNGSPAATRQRASAKKQPSRQR